VWPYSAVKTADCELKLNVFSNSYLGHKYETYQLYSRWDAPTNTKKMES